MSETSELTVESFPSGPLGVNCVLVRSGNEATVVDPGGNAKDILQWIETNRLDLKLILLTHGHFDHVGGVMELARKTNGKVALHPADKWLYEHQEEQCSMFGLQAPEVPGVSLELMDGLVLRCGEHEMRVIETPGHSPGSVCFFLPSIRILLSGDTLFEASVGRTDLWGSSQESLLDSIRQKLYPLGDDVRVIPGHGGETSLGQEMKYNPFAQQ